MCSIAGIISPRPFEAALLQEMNACMKHRGPDGEGFYFWNDDNIRVHFAHNRLSIIDPTPSSDQPFRFLNRYSLIFNGEIYNYKELRVRLEGEGLAFQTEGDTEVVAAAYAAWGDGCLDQFDGMFAFAIWDEQERTLFAARDRFGEKPFYYHYDRANNTLVFASEIKAILKAGIPNDINNPLLYNYLTLGHTKQVAWPDNTFYNHVFQLPPSHKLNYHAGQKQEPVIERYFDLDKASVISIDEENAEEHFIHLFKTSVQRRLRSDVPLGSSLSGGLDSSSITALCHSLGNGQYSHHAFSAIFPGFEKDESELIGKMASAYHLNMHYSSPTGSDLASQLPALVKAQEEPFGSASVFAQYDVFATAKKNGITVLLDGQGADESLGGYTKYTHWYLQELAGDQGWKKADASAGSFKANGFLDEWGWKNRVAAVFPALTASMLSRKAFKAQSQNPWINKLFRGEYADRDSIFKPIVEQVNDIQYHDLMIMGLEELLRYADKNSMAHSREVRLPFLSHELVQFCLSLPSSFRFRNGFTKWILRDSMKSVLPASITWQKGKTGFEPPQEVWMNETAVRELLMESRKKLVDRNILDRSVLQKPIVPTSAHAEDNFDFRCLVAGLWISGLMD